LLLAGGDGKQGIDFAWPNFYGMPMSWLMKLYQNIDPLALLKKIMMHRECLFDMNVYIAVQS